MLNIPLTLGFFVVQALCLSISVPQDVVQGEATAVSWTRQARDPENFDIHLDTRPFSTFHTINTRDGAGTVFLTFQDLGAQSLVVPSKVPFFPPLATSNGFTVKQRAATPPQQPPPPPQNNPTNPQGGSQQGTSNSQNTANSAGTNQNQNQNQGPNQSKSGSVTASPAPENSASSNPSDTILGAQGAIANPTTDLSPVNNNGQPTGAADNQVPTPSAPPLVGTGEVPKAKPIVIVIGVLVPAVVLIAAGSAVYYVRHRKKANSRRLSFHRDMMVRESNPSTGGNHVSSRQVASTHSKGGAVSVRSTGSRGPTSPRLMASGYSSSGYPSASAALAAARLNMQQYNTDIEAANSAAYDGLATGTK